MKKILCHICIYGCMLIVSCNSSDNFISDKGFYEVMENLAQGWSTQNTEKALNCFTDDAVYMEPPEVQYYRGHKELRPYFDALDSNYKMEFHNLWFNEETQSGAGEFTFSYGKDTSDVGIVVVELEKGKINFWREYHKKGPTDFNEFISTENKEWEWHIGNYPATEEIIDTSNVK